MEIAVVQGLIKGEATKAEAAGVGAALRTEIQYEASRKWIGIARSSMARFRILSQTTAGATTGDDGDETGDSEVAVEAEEG
ncbi:hypothetical protein HPP92_029163 [Vanilla planifolia]|uniref:Uncharacterized protein n=1 Tax=Vanilla planifolia TaxID=51239 RepID=A0A835U1B8_VANPL|nr:hypothetical protein HPP92_029163 [Vanilla planifolia]KAG0445795.1 hypothetical protein HPP92_029152 [Vanilla planifolia]